jgi:hypothetical protein
MSLPLPSGVAWRKNSSLKRRGNLFITSKIAPYLLLVLGAGVLWIPAGRAQTAAIAGQGATAVPRLVPFNGVVKETAGKPVAGLTFALYKNQECAAG